MLSVLNCSLLFQVILATFVHYFYHMQIVYFYREYDPGKEIAIFITGIMIASDVEQKLRMLAEKYNVIVVEAIQEHYKYIFQEEPITEIIELYYSLIDLFVPAGAMVKLITGMSYGGKLAYLMACRWHDGHGQLPAVLMGDTVITNNPQLCYAALQGKLDDYIEENNLPRELFNPSFKERFTIVSQIESRGVTLPVYSGRVVLVHTTVASVVFPDDNAARWRQNVSHIELVPQPYLHNVIACDNPETLPLWQQLFSEDY